MAPLVPLPHLSLSAVEITESVVTLQPINNNNNGRPEGRKRPAVWPADVGKVAWIERKRPKWSL